MCPTASYATSTRSIFPADLPYLSFRRISLKVVQVVPGGKKKLAAASTMSQSCRKRTGQVTTTLLASKILQTPKGFSALSLVQEGTLLLKGQSLFLRYRSALAEKLSTGKPNTSASGWSGITSILIKNLLSHFIFPYMSSKGLAVMFLQPLRQLPNRR